MRTAFFAASFGVLLLAGCAPPADTPAATAPLVTVRASGGMCPEGTCGSTVSIYEDGRCVHESPRTESVTARLEDGDVALLKKAIDDVDVAAVKSRPFTGTCPIAYDGSTLTYEFQKDGVTQTLNDCEYELDEPLFKMIDEMKC